MRSALALDLRLPRFNFKAADIGAYSTVRYLGVLDNTVNTLRDENIWYHEIDLDKPGATLDARLHFPLRGNVTLGFRQLANSRWPATPLYCLSINSAELAKTIAGDGVLNVRLKLRGSSKDSAPESFILSDAWLQDGTPVAADALTLKLNTLADRRHSGACASHGCVGLYGYAQSAKAHLLTTLCGNENGKLEIITPDRDYDYFSHINPGHAPANMAIRFTRDIFSNESGWPLRLRLISEAELVQIFIAWTSSSPVCRQVEKSIITSRLEKWQSLRQPQPVPGVTAEEVATIASFWRSCLPSARQHIDDATWQHFASLLPALDLTTRAHAWALLWGEQPEITQQWLALAHMLQQTGHAGELADNVDLLDIPVAPDSHPHPLWRAKLGWMLAHYRQQVQPDVLVICNALASRSQTSTAAHHLLEWVNATQPQHESALPGVVWAITPQDARFATQQNLDEAVQQLMGKPGVHWGTLQALDKHSMQRLVEWLSQATSAPQRQARLQALREQLRGRVRDLLPMFDDARLRRTGLRFI